MIDLRLDPPQWRQYLQVGIGGKIKQPLSGPPEIMVDLSAISVGVNPPHDVNVIIEVPIGGEPIKYEIDKNSGILVVDRFLYTSMRYPGNYGFIPHTLSDDGDPCDVLVVNTRAITPGAMMSVQIGRAHV